MLRVHFSNRAPTRRYVHRLDARSLLVWALLACTACQVGQDGDGARGVGGPSPEAGLAQPPVDGGLMVSDATEPRRARDGGAAPAEPAPSTDDPQGAASMEDSGAGEPPEPSRQRTAYSQPPSDDPDPCHLNSGWDGDAYCLLPPPPGEGIQLHFGPTDYADVPDSSWYLRPANDSDVGSALLHIPLTEDRAYRRITVQMRPSLLSWMIVPVDDQPEEAVSNAQGCDLDQFARSLVYGQNFVHDDPPGGIAAPENEGFSHGILRAGTSLCISIVDALGPRPALREMWINAWFAEPADVAPRNVGGLVVMGSVGLRLPPGQSTEVSHEMTLGRGGRLLRLFVHRRQWTTRAAAWLNDRLIYESYDFAEAATFDYDTLITNPPLDSTRRKDGAVSGNVAFQAGDVVKVACQVDNTSDNILTFGTYAEGEQCVLYGITDGASQSEQF